MCTCLFDKIKVEPKVHAIKIICQRLFDFERFYCVDIRVGQGFNGSTTKSESHFLFL